MAQRRIAVDDVQQLAELLSSRDQHDRKDQVPEWVDPAKYPRHVEIDDPEALALIERLDELVGEMRAFMRKAERLEANLTLTRSELYDKLEARYPDILKIRRGGAGMRDWRGKWWYVGWDSQKFAEENDDRQRMPGGNYL